MDQSVRSLEVMKMHACTVHCDTNLFNENGKLFQPPGEHFYRMTLRPFFREKRFETLTPWDTHSWE
jgi:hypothetical protein